MDPGNIFDGEKRAGITSNEEDVSGRRDKTVQPFAGPLDTEKSLLLSLQYISNGKHS